MNDIYYILLNKVKEKGIVKIILENKRNLEMYEYIKKNKHVLNEIKNIIYFINDYKNHYIFTELNINNIKTFYIFKNSLDLDLIILRGKNKKCIYKQYDIKMKIFKQYIKKLDVDTLIL